MIPQVKDDLKQDFTFTTAPSRTFRMNYETQSIIGTIENIDAVAQAVYLILNVERYEWMIYSWNYGVELRHLIGRPVDFCIPEIERCIREALLQDDRIISVEDFRFQVKKNIIHTTFTVVSIYGSMIAEKEVET